MKVLFLTNIPSPYRVDFFNEFGKYCDLTVLFERKKSTERDESWNFYKFNTFRGIFLNGKGISADKAFCIDVIKFLNDKSYDNIICSTFADPTGMLAIQYMKLHHISYYLECDGGFAKSGKGLKEQLKRYFIKGAKGYFSTGHLCDLYYRQYGADITKIYRYPFSSLHKSNLQKTCISNKEKDQLRKKLEVKEKYMVLTVGQFIYRKGFDVLLKAMRFISDDVGVYFVGGSPIKEYIQIQKRYNLKNAHFISFKNKEKLAEYFKAADLFAFPTREDIWGLVVQEAMAYGLPVVSTDRCAAALELIQNEKNGYIVPVENDKLLADCIMTIVNDEDRRHKFGVNSLSIIQEYTIEQMVKKHLLILEGEDITKDERK